VVTSPSLPRTVTEPSGSVGTGPLDEGAHALGAVLAGEQRDGVGLELCDRGVVVRCASAASNGSPVSRCFIALPQPASRGMRIVAPANG
jgi:hypothetical protein